MSRIIAAFAACAALLVWAAAAPAGELKTATMGNGLTVIIRENHSTPLVSVQAWVRSGSSNETVNTNGISHMIEHLAIGKTNKRSASDMDIEMESLGGTLAAETSRDWTHFSATVHPRYMGQALDMLADALNNAAFPEQDVEREKMVILEEIKRKQLSPRQLVSDALYREMYGTHPDSLPIEGTETSVRQLNRQQIVDFYQTYYTAPNMAIVLVGDIDFQQAVSDIGKSFQILRRSPAPEPYPVKLEPPTTAKTQTLEGYTRNSIYSIGFLGPAGSYFRDVCAIDTIAAHLGIGYRSWVSRELKQNLKIALDGSSEFLTSRFAAPVSLNVSCDESKLGDVEAAVRAKIGDICKNGMGEDALQMAKLSILGDYAFQKETVDGTANGYGFYYAVSGPEFADKYVSLIQSLTNEDIQQVASKYLDLDRSITVKVVPMRIEGPSEEELK